MEIKTNVAHSVGAKQTLSKFSQEKENKGRSKKRVSFVEADEGASPSSSGNITFSSWKALLFYYFFVITYISAKPLLVRMWAIEQNYLRIKTSYPVHSDIRMRFTYRLKAGLRWILGTSFGLFRILEWDIRTVILPSKIYQEISF